jgi:hypothetical protein
MEKILEYWWVYLILITFIVLAVIAPKKPKFKDYRCQCKGCHKTFMRSRGYRTELKTETYQTFEPDYYEPGSGETHTYTKEVEVFKGIQCPHCGAWNQYIKV